MISDEILAKCPFFVVVGSHFVKVGVNFRKILTFHSPITCYNHHNRVACKSVSDVSAVTGHPPDGRRAHSGPTL